MVEFKWDAVALLSSSNSCREACFKGLQSD